MKLKNILLGLVFILLLDSIYAYTITSNADIQRYVIIEDSHVSEDNPNSNVESNSNLISGIETGDTGRYNIYMKFNISWLGTDLIINESLAYMFISSNNLESGETFNISSNHVYNNYSWTENGITWNNRPTGTDKLNSTFEENIRITSSEVNTYKEWNITNMLRREYSESSDNMTVAFLPNDPVNTESGDTVTFYPIEVSTFILFVPLIGVTYTDSYLPTYTDFELQPSEAKITQNINFSINFTDNDVLYYYIFSHNQSGSFTNKTVNITDGTYQPTSPSTIIRNQVIKEEITINLTRNNTICGKYYITDVSENINETDLICFNVTNTEADFNVSINPKPAEDTDDLIGNITDFYDIDGDSWVLNETRWYNDSIEVTELRNKTNVLAGNTTTDELWVFSARVYDGYNWSEYKNSSSLTIGDTTPPVINSLNISRSEFTTINPMTITANCTDVSSDISQVIVTINNDNRTLTFFEGDLYTYTNTYGAGSYTITKAYCTDSSGNSLEENYSLSFVVLTTSAGGGGGTIDIGGKECDWNYPEEIIFTPRQTFKEIEIENNENESIQPILRFDGDISQYVSIANIILVIYPGTSQSYGIKFDSGTEFVESEGIMEVYSENCLPVEIKLISDKTDFQAFSLTELNVTDLINTNVFGNVNIGMLSGLLFVLLIALSLNPLSGLLENQKYLRFVLLFGVIVMVTFFISLVMYIGVGD